MVLTHLVLFNFFHGATAGDAPPPVVVTTTTPSGVKHGRKGGGKRPFIVNLSEVEDRQSTAEFLKSQLRLRQPFEEIPQPKPVKQKETRAQRMARERLAAETSRAMAIEQEQRELVASNNEILLLLLTT